MERTANTPAARSEPFPQRGGKVLAACVAAITTLGCGSGLSSDFEGSWREQSGRYTDSCDGDLGPAMISDYDFTIQLRLRGAALEYVLGSGIPSCVRVFSLEGRSAQIQPNQSCEVWLASGDPEGAPMKSGIKVRYPQDLLTLDGDTLKETGTRMYDHDPTSCVRFESDFTRIE